MTNEMKLLRAFIEASGFDIETTEDIKRFYKPVDLTLDGKVKENAFPDSVIKTTDYKVTKRPVVMLKDVIVGDVPLTQYIQNILELKENSEKYRFIIYSREIIDTIIKSGYFIIVDEIEGGYLIEGVRVIYEKI